MQILSGQFSTNLIFYNIPKSYGEIPLLFLSREPMRSLLPGRPTKIRHHCTALLLSNIMPILCRCHSQVFFSLLFYMLHLMVFLRHVTAFMMFPHQLQSILYSALLSPCWSCSSSSWSLSVRGYEKQLLESHCHRSALFYVLARVDTF